MQKMGNPPGLPIFCDISGREGKVMFLELFVEPVS
jgi:hypothetical protein